MAAGKSKSTGMFDPEALIEAQKRNFQALADAGNIVADGMRSYAERHVAIARDSVAQLWSELQGIGKRKPAAPTDQLAQMRSTFEKVVAQIQELGQHVLDVQSQALAVLNECATKNLEALGHAAPELAEFQQKAKQAFEQATHQTSVVIDEMKRRVASIEEAAKGEVAAPAPAPKPAPVKAEPAPPPPAPKPAAAKPSPAKAAPKRAPRAAGAKPKAT
ncbi:MAG: phasin family protein [Geminicoccaceae bacterium]